MLMSLDIFSGRYFDIFPFHLELRLKPCFISAGKLSYVMVRFMLQKTAVASLLDLFLSVYDSSASFQPFFVVKTVNNQ